MITPALIAERFARTAVSRPKVKRRVRNAPVGRVLRTLVADHNSDGEFIPTDNRHFDVLGRTRSAREALALAARLHPDVVMLAFTIPDMNIVEVIRQLKSMPKAPRIVILSNYAEPCHQQLVLGAGADEFVVKTELDSRMLARIAQRCSELIKRTGTRPLRGQGKPSWLLASVAAAVIVVAASCVVGAAFTSWHYWQDECRADQQQREMYLKYWEGELARERESR